MSDINVFVSLRYSMSDILFHLIDVYRQGKVLRDECQVQDSCLQLSVLKLSHIHVVHGPDRLTDV